MGWENTYQSAWKRRSDGAGGSAYQFQYIEITPAVGSLTSSVGVVKTMPSDGQTINADGNGASIGWRADDGNISGVGLLTALTPIAAGTWAAGDVLGLGFITTTNYCMLIFFKNGVARASLTLSDYLASPVRPGAAIRLGAAITMTLDLTTTYLPGGFSNFTGVTWLDENTIVLSGSDLIAAEGSVANYTPVRTTTAGDITY